MNLEANWAGNHVYRAATIHHPRSIEDLQEIVARADRIHALGSRHCFNDIADSGELVSLDQIDIDLEIVDSRTTITVGAGIRYGDLAIALEREGLALHNMASLPHISVAGAIATATHGSGDFHGNLATAVAGMQMVTSSGEFLDIVRGDPDFAGMVVGLGALGVVTRVTLDVQPTFQVRQDVFEHLEWEAVFDDFDAITAAAYSVSLFTDWGPDVDVLWLKTLVPANGSASTVTIPWKANPATRDRHPLATLTSEACTAQLGIAGAWSDRLPHFRAESIPASGSEIQAEYMIARQHALPAIAAMRDLGPRIRPDLLLSEIRTVAGDDLWLSSAYGVDTVCIHFSFKHDQRAVDQLLPVIEDALAPFNPRPHWGKVFAATASDLAPRYERMGDFRRLAARLDSRGAFHNDYLASKVLG